MSFLDEFTPAAVGRIRAANDRRYRGWSARRVVRLHEQTLAGTKDPEAYLAGIRARLADGTYRRIYPPHVVEATRAFLASCNRPAWNGQGRTQA